MPMRGLLTASSIDPTDAERIVAAGRRLGVAITVRPAESQEQLGAILAELPDAVLMLGDFLPDRPDPSRDSRYAFGAAADHASDAPADPEEIRAIVRDLRWVQLTAAGVNQEATSLTWRAAPQVTVTTASGLPSVAMAQYINAAILHHAHRFGILDRYRDVRDWSVRRTFWTEILLGKTLGLLGYGGTGRRAARIAHSIGLRVIAVRRGGGDGEDTLRFQLPAVAELDAGPDPAEVWPASEGLDRVLSESDYLACTLPLTAETRGMIGARELGLLKPTAYVINVSRGPIFDEPALVDALRGGRIAGAALDVFASEPLPADSPLWDLPNVLLTPHSSGTHDHVSEFTAELFITNLERFVAGQRLLNVAERARGY